ncbi:MAG: phosphatidylglycerol lysyltransferase domain-containing protein [Muribaculaceae bacterium]|nr:phosphatidylglycerol lysyltransferase domain-containing protein [Muribaculaceae bacterium]
MRTIGYSTGYVPARSRRTKLSTDILSFKPVTLSAIPVLRGYMERSDSRANDFSIGGILMWADYFHYEYCIFNDTLFIKGVSEVNPELPAFSLPVGRMSLRESVGMIVDYCRRAGIAPRLSAVPADRIEELTAAMPGRVEELADWSDYIYDATALASLSGKKLSKKRNHVNRFMADNPDYRFEPLSAANLPAVRDAYLGWLGRDAGPGLDAASAIEESAQTLSVMDNLAAFGFEGAVLYDGDGRIVAFTMGEVIGDTLFTHIEKMDHGVAGAGETVNKLFAVMMTGRHPSLRYINREEDAGDEGLRQAKLSYNPAIILKKYDVVL